MVIIIIGLSEIPQSMEDTEVHLKELKELVEDMTQIPYFFFPNPRRPEVESYDL